jgi:hypothetical protein
VSLDPTRSLPRPPQAPDRRLWARTQRAGRQRLTRQDRLGARLAEIHLIRGLVSAAVPLVSAGWVQHVWFEVTDPHGHRTRVTAHNLDAVSEQPVSGVCLVGAVVHAAGGPATVHSQLVQRTLDLTWHALYERPSEPVRWCPAPAVRATHVRDLTRWNDRPGRTAGEVTALLRDAARTAEFQTGLLRASAAS